MPHPSPDDLHLLYTGGTTGMPKGVLWRQHDIYVSSMGGRPFGSDQPYGSYEQIATAARLSGGAVSLLLIPPLMHGAGQWASMSMVTMGGRIVIPDDVERLDAVGVLKLAERERVMSIPTIGDAVVRPLIEELERRNYDLSGLMTISNSGAPLTPTISKRVLAALPNVLLIDGVGASETGLQMSATMTSGASADTATFAPHPDTSVVAADFSRVLTPGEGLGWLRAGTTSRWDTSATQTSPPRPSRS